MGDIFKDKRFEHVIHDPRFRKIPKSERKVKVDKRFQSMFKDKKFNVKYTVDKRGRPVFNSSGEDLKRYYDISSEEEESGSSSGNESEIEKNSFEKLNSNSEVTKVKRDRKSSSLQLEKKEVLENGISKTLKKKKNVNTGSTEENSENNSLHVKSSVKPQETNEVADEIRKKLQDSTVDYARGEGVLFSSSSSDEEEESEREPDDELDHGWGELDHDAERTDEATSRLALCNMDWDRIRAEDLMILFNSFLPPDGLIKSVLIYPSEFGLKRMKEEELNGPQELLDDNVSSSDDDEDEQLGDDSAVNDADEQLEGNTYRMEKLRQYQLNRLKYYYAVIVFDSVKTADKVYNECDGLEYESSATRLDLRFIPDDMVFDQEPKDKCEKMPDPSKYQPRFFTTTALQQAKVKLTWDETDPSRMELTKKLQSCKSEDLLKLPDAELQDVVATDSEEEDQDSNIEDTELGNSNELTDSDLINSYRELLQDCQKRAEEKKSRDVDMEITWGLGLKEKAEKLLKEKTKEVTEEKTPFQQYLEKRKEKKKQKKQEKLKKKNKLKSEEVDSSEDDNVCSDDDIPSDIDMNDPYFAEEFTDVKSKAKEKKKKKKRGENEEKSTDEEKLNKAELELLLLNEDSEKKHFSLKSIQKQEETLTSKRKKKEKKKKKNNNEEDVQKDDDFEVNVSDERFSALFTSHHFNIDPADSHYRKTKAMETLRAEKLKRRQEDNGNLVPDKVQKPKKDSEIHKLISSVKMKTKTANKR